MSSYRAPTPEAVRAAIMKIPTVQLRQVFYGGLKNPLWVRPLFQAGAFSNPPEPEFSGDGFIRDIYWPELAYLTRVAVDVPSDVVDVFLQLPNSSNAWVRRAVFEIGSQIPPDEAVRLVPLLEKWRSSGFGWRTDSRDLVAFAAALLHGGHPKEGRWLANALFAPRAPDEEGGNQVPRVGLDDYWYDDALPTIVPALGENALRALTGWLRSYVTISGHASGERDFSGMDRPSIAERRYTTSRPEDSLIDAVRDEAIRAALIDPDGTLDILLQGNVQLLHKIAIYIIAEAMRRSIGEGGGTHRFVTAARRLLSDVRSDDENLRVEYAELARVAAGVDYSVTAVITPFLEQAYAADLAWMSERFAAEGASASEGEVSIRERADRYRHGWLAAIGHDALPPELQTELVELDAQFGVVEDPLHVFGQVTSWTGPNAHTGQDQMARMAPAELVACLSGWRDDGDRWGPRPSHEGQGRELAALLTTNPLAFSGVARLEDKLRPTYLRASLEGWRAALKADLDLDWQQTAEVIQAVLDHGLSSELPAEGDDFDDDKNYRGAKDAAVDLLDQLMRGRDSQRIPVERIERFAQLLIQNADDDSAWSEYDSYQHSGDGWDPLNMSLNWQWPSRVRALVAAATYPDPAPWRDDAFAALEREMGRSDRHGAGRAVLGESFGRLYVNARAWLDEHLDCLVGSRSEISLDQQVVLTTAMAVNRYHPDLFDLLSEPMQAAIGIGESLKAGWSGEMEPLPRIGEWAIYSVIYGHKTKDDPVVDLFFTSAEPKVRGEAMGHVAWSFFQASHIDDAIRDRFASLWDERIAHVRSHRDESQELEGIYWLAKCKALAPTWWLPRLDAALELEPSIATERYMIGKELAQASTVDPGTALSVLKRLLDGRGADTRIYHHMSRYAIPMVIANAMNSGDTVLAAEADAYMNELGALGLLTLEEEVKAILDGVIKVDDVEE